jgi:glycerol uptake facilitator-like aquaporin
MTDIHQLRALGMEFLGTFSLIFIGGWSVFQASSPGSTGPLIAAMTHAAILGIFIYMGASVSGANYNPAVSLALMFTGNLNVVKGLFYIGAQLIGSVVAGLALKIMRPDAYKNFNLGFPHLHTTPTQGFFMELLGTFYLIFTILVVAVHKKSSEIVCAGVISTSLFLGISSFGAVTGGALNPARTFGPSLVNGELLMKGWWTYIAGPLLGGIFAALVYGVMFGSSTEADEKAETKNAKEVPIL